MTRAAAALLLLACGPAAPTPTVSGDVRQARDRPPVVIVARDGDPASAVSMAILTGDDPAAAAAIAGLAEARVPKARVTPAWDGVRVTVLVDSRAAAQSAVDAMRSIAVLATRDEDLAHAKKKLAALSARPLADAALVPWARCSGAERAPATTAADMPIGELESLRGQIGNGRVAFAVVGARDVGEIVAKAIADGPAWKNGAALPSPGAPKAVSVFESTTTVARVHIALASGSSGAAVKAADALGDPKGPLETRLHGLDSPFHLREVVGTAHANGGCVAMVLEGGGGSDVSPARVADAVALVDVETRLAERREDLDGAKLARRAGDVREAAERAAWWTLADRSASSGAAIVLEVPSRRSKEEKPVEPSADALGQAIEAAKAAWQKPVVEGRVRVEAGQGEAWMLLASPCGTDVEGELDAGVTALAITAAREALPEAEAFVAADGAGLLIHGPPLPGESPVAQAQRLGDALARGFASVTKARAAVSVKEDPNGVLLGSVLAPSHPSWVLPWGQSDATLRIGEGAVLTRAQALRSGPLRLAVIANGDRGQGEAAVRAADRWIDRRGDQARACPTLPELAPSKPGTYALDTKPGAMPEALLAYPFTMEDEPAARAVALAFEGDEGLLGKALGDLAGKSSARVMGVPRAPALVIRVSASQSSLDQAVAQTRALVDRVRQNGLAAPDLERAQAAHLGSTLDPRARLVAAWRGIEPKIGSSDEIRTFAQRALGEDRLVVVAARPPRQK